MRRACAPSTTDDNHYAQAEAQGVDMKSTLTLVTQSGLYGIPDRGRPPFVTTRASTSSFFINGTNRAMFRYT